MATSATLKTLPLATLWLNAFNGVIAQGTYSVRRNNEDDPSLITMCAYRSTDDAGNVVKCGIGHSIPDAEYVPKMEGSTASHVAFDRNELDEDKWVARLFFMQKLQEIHDDSQSEARSMEEFKVAMIGFAKKNKLPIPDSVS